jgi:Flp pilus assembly pilin Flp
VCGGLAIFVWSTLHTFKIWIIVRVKALWTGFRGGRTGGRSMKRTKQLRRGATMVEYGLIVTLIANAQVIILGLLGDALNITFQTVIENLAK